MTNSKYMHVNVNRTSREYLAQVANALVKNIHIISDKSNDAERRNVAVAMVKDTLLKLLDLEDLDYLTDIYRDTEPTTSVNVGFDHNAVVDFVNKFNAEDGRDVVEHVIDPRVNSMEKLFGISSDNVSIPYSQIATDYGYLFADMMVMSEKLRHRHDKYTKLGMPDENAWSLVERDIYQTFDDSMVVNSIPMALLNQAIDLIED